MEHPVRNERQLEYRRKLATLLKQHFDLVRHDNIVFVCGGNEPADARTRFLEIASTGLADYDLFTPELALKSIWRDDDGPFELTAFEELIAEVSDVIVIFPESPGSLCEVGYFVAKDNIIQKTLLAINRNFEKSESFISSGPVNLINTRSYFRPTYFIDYSGDFSEIIDRIRKRRPDRSRVAIRVQEYRELKFIQKLGMVQKVIDVLTMATREDVEFIFRSTFSSHISVREINGLISILHGSEYLIRVDDYGHYRTSSTKKSFLESKPGSKTLETEVHFEMATIIEECDEFSQLVSAVQNAA